MVTDYWKGEIGGIATFLSNLVGGLKEIGLDVSVVFRYGYDEDNSQASGNDLLFALKAFLKISKCRPDVVHCHSSWYCLFPGILFGILNDASVIFTYHTKPERRTRKPIWNLLKWMLDRCNCVTYVSKGLNESVELVEGLRPLRTEVIYGAASPVDQVSQVEITRFLEELSIPEGSVILCGLGLTALREKADGARLLIKAVEELSKRNIEIRLILTKEGRYSNELRSYAKALGIEDKIIFTGDLERPALALRSCDIYTHISYGEGLPMAILEAMSIGKPIIATPVDGIPEAIQDGLNGLLVELDPGRISEKIEFLIDHPEICMDLGLRAFETARDKFTWESSARNFHSLYLESKVSNLDENGSPTV